MKKHLTSRSIGSAIVLFAVVAAMIVTPGAPAAAAGMSAAAVPANAAITGLGFWEAVSCMGCIAGFVVGGGMNIVGLAAFLAANPEIGILCVANCAAAI